MKKSRAARHVVKNPKPLPCPDCKFCWRCIAAQKIGFTPQEMRVVQMIVDGSPSKVISAELNISEETVKRHLTNIFNKAGVDDRTNLAIKAIESGWVRIPGLDRPTESKAHIEDSRVMAILVELRALLTEIAMAKIAACEDQPEFAKMQLVGR